MTAKYSRWRVRVTDPGGVHTTLSTAVESVARKGYAQQCRAVGTHLYRVERIGIDAAGIEHVVEVCELRTDLYAGVQPEPQARFEQIALL